MSVSLGWRQVTWLCRVILMEKGYEDCTAGGGVIRSECVLDDVGGVCVQKSPTCWGLSAPNFQAHVTVRLTPVLYRRI